MSGEAMPPGDAEKGKKVGLHVEGFVTLA